MSPEASRSPADAPGVAALDGLAARLAAAAGLRVEPARTRGELEAALRLRYRQVVAHGWAAPAELGPGVEEDPHDAAAVLVAAWDGDTLVGTVRLVPPRAGEPLPVEAAYGLEVEPRGRVVEIGRLVIAPERRGDPAHRAWGALFARTWMEVRARGFVVMAGAASAGMVARYRALGLPFEILGPARVHWGQERHPVRLDPARADRPAWFANAEMP
jgi:N-acyl-L-homoserine lactone synthetase